MAADVTFIRNRSTEVFANFTKDTSSDLELPETMLHVFYVVGIVVCIVAIVGNLMVIISFVKFPAVRTTSNYFLLSLAFADVTSGPAVLMFLVINLVNVFKIGRSAQMLCVIAINMNVVAFAGSVFSLLGVACERYIKVIYSLRSQTMMPPHRAKYFLAVLWTFNIVISAPVLVWNRPIHGRCNKRVFYPIHLYAVLMPPVTVAILVTTVLYARLFGVAWRHRHAIRALELSTAAGCSGYVAVAKKEAKLTKTGGMIIGVLYASWLPYIIGNILLGETDDTVSIGLRQTIFLMLSASSMINPVVYQWRIPEFHTAFRKLLPFFQTTHTHVDST